MCVYLTWEGGYNIIIEKTKKIEITRWNVAYYSKFKPCLTGDFIDIDIHLLGDSHSSKKVKAQCDYCDNIFFTTVKTAITAKNHKYNKKHACKKCTSRKRKETNLLKYGVDNPMKVDEFKQSQINTVNDIYGVDNVFQSEEVKDKIRKTMIDRYGADNPMKVEHIKERSVRSSRKSLMKNGATPTSRQQLYLHKLYGGVLNYAKDRVLLDIAFPDEKIYIEYDGGGHDLSVKIGRETAEEFQSKERKRFHFLRSKGWRCFIINSPRDYLPVDEILIDELHNAKKVFKKGKTRYTITLESKIESEKYGTMRAIR